MNRVRLLALARKVLDESSPEPERVTSGNMLAKEIVKMFESGIDLTISEEEFAKRANANSAEREAADRAEHVVQQAVRKAEAKAHVQPESEPTWVDFDPPGPKPPATVGGSFDDNAFGRPPRAPRTRR